MIAAIDPGAAGAIAFLSPDGALASVVDMPAVKVGTKLRVAPQAVALLLAARRPSHCFIEQVGAMPGQGVVSMFAFGQAVGILDGAVAALGIPVSYIAPAAWKRGMQVSADKGSSRRRAMQLFPSHADAFQRVRDDGRAEAALLGVYGLRTTAREAT